MVDLDSTKLTPPTGGYDEISPLPEPEGTILKNHLKQVRKAEKAVAANQEEFRVQAQSKIGLSICE